LPYNPYIISVVAVDAPPLYEQGKLPLGWQGWLEINGSKIKEGATVNIDGVQVAEYNYQYLGGVWGDKLKVKITILADAPLGKKDVTLTNPDGGVGTKKDAFEVVPLKPHIISISPYVITFKGRNKIKIETENAHFEAGETQVSFKDSPLIQVAGVEVVNNNKLFVYVKPVLPRYKVAQDKQINIKLVITTGDETIEHWQVFILKAEGSN
jgi:hypothetical protein